MDVRSRENMLGAPARLQCQSSIEKYGIHQGILVLDDSDRERSKNTKPSAKGLKDWRLCNGSKHRSVAIGYAKDNVLPTRSSNKDMG